MIDLIISLIFRWPGGKHESFDSPCNKISGFKGRRAAREGGVGRTKGNTLNGREE